MMISTTLIFRRLFRDPLAHFLLLGLLLFGVDAIVNGDSRETDPDRIEVTAADIEWLRTSWIRQWNRPPTERELEGLIESHVREEVLYREALAMGLEEDDVIIRRRLAQKIAFLSEDLIMQAEPSESELRAYLEEHRERYRIPARLTFTHIYFSTDRRSDSGADAEFVLTELSARREPPGRAPELGDRFMLQYDYASRSTPEIEQLFGRSFTDQLFALEPGPEWQGPVASSYGHHLVRISEREESRLPELTEVIGRVLADYDTDRREQANQTLYETLLGRYEVAVDEDAVRGFVASPRGSGRGR